MSTPQVKAFCNSYIRQGAQDLADMYVKAKKVVTVFNARGLAQEIPADDTPIDDGADQDGRPVITGNDVHKVVALLEGFCEEYEANTSTNLVAVAKVAPNI